MQQDGESDPSKPVRQVGRKPLLILVALVLMLFVLGAVMVYLQSHETHGTL